MALPVTDDYGKTLNDAWDYKGQLANRSKTGGWISSAMILGRHFFLLCRIFSKKSYQLKFKLLYL